MKNLFKNSQTFKNMQKTDFFKFLDQNTALIKQGIKAFSYNNNENLCLRYIYSIFSAKVMLMQKTTNWEHTGLHVSIWTKLSLFLNSGWVPPRENSEFRFVQFLAMRPIYNWILYNWAINNVLFDSECFFPKIILRTLSE